MSGKGSNVLPQWGNEKTMNLNTMILTNIQSSPYFKVQLFDLKTYHEVIDEIYYKVNHLEPWEKGSRKLSGQTGMCGGVRGVGAGGIVSSAFCLLYKLYTLKLTRKQLTGLLNHSDSPYIRGLGFMYVRYTQPPPDLWDWMEPYLDDDEEIDVKAGGGCVMTIGEMCREFLVKLDWYSALFPRIPVPIQKDLDIKMRGLLPPPRAVGGGGGEGVGKGDQEEDDAQNGEGNRAVGDRNRGEHDEAEGSGGRPLQRPPGPTGPAPRREQRERSPDAGSKRHGSRQHVGEHTLGEEDDDYRRALEREKERQRKSRHGSSARTPPPRHSGDVKEHRHRSRSHDRHRHRTSSRDRHRDKSPHRNKSSRKDRSRSRGRSQDLPEDRPKRSRSRDRMKTHKSSSVERHRGPSSRDRRDDSRTTLSGGYKRNSPVRDVDDHSRRSPVRRSPVRDRGDRHRTGPSSPSERQESDGSRSLEKHKRRKVSRSRSRDRGDHRISKTRNADSPPAKG